jgi:hypothetical protein
MTYSKFNTGNVLILNTVSSKMLRHTYHAAAHRLLITDAVYRLFVTHGTHPPLLLACQLFY